MYLQNIEKRILTLCPFVKDIVVTIENGHPFATIYPNFKALKSAHIVNIENEFRWYAVELYNMEVEESQKVKGYRICKFPLAKTNSNQNTINDEPTDDLYQSIKSQLSTQSSETILSDSHLELDLGLDSLDYVELFVFIENSYGVKINEKIFSEIMTMQDLYKYIKEHKKYIKPTKTQWEDILNENHDEKLIFSPFIMFMYKVLLFPLFKLFFGLEVKGIENVPYSSCIIAPTHQSMLDGFLIEATLPYSILKNSFFLAFRQVFGTKLLHPIATYGQTILIDANINLKETMKHAALPLKEKKNLVIFPEGARTRDRKLLEFRPFFAMLSKTHNVPIVPVIIDGSFEALPSGKIFPRPKKIKLTYLEPIYPSDISYDELTALVKQTIKESM
ncbi:1-acyl-sn-glycerol-3-phosphate acyltransferase [Sulfurimonas sp.]|uniref:1-acyl-sn-glycerol-3-phosphate acyltransferase n=1 Tax=Sulfurimonas sp. TaxID=2022749 RepID=UPI0025D43CA5|nr:1-acyl-sn-glycerol-3-phosphate acyltransferase [Sulfurimonas sp.]